MDILPGQEGRLHVFIPGGMSQNPQFDLTVIRIHQHMAGLRGEKGPQLAPQLRADGDILEVGLVAGKPPGPGLRLIEAAVDPAVGADGL